MTIAVAVPATSKALCENTDGACLKKQKNGSKDCVICPSAKHNKRGGIKTDMPSFKKHSHHQGSSFV